MSEVIEGFRLKKELNRQERQKMKAAYTQILIDEKIQFKSYNSGNHLVIETENRRFDFWPSTGRWTVSNMPEFCKRINGSGIDDLIKLVKE